MAAQASGRLRQFPTLGKARRRRRFSLSATTRRGVEKSAELTAISIVVTDSENVSADGMRPKPAADRHRLLRRKDCQAVGRRAARQVMRIYEMRDRLETEEVGIAGG